MSQDTPSRPERIRYGRIERVLYMVRLYKYDPEHGWIATKEIRQSAKVTALELNRWCQILETFYGCTVLAEECGNYCCDCGNQEAVFWNGANRICVICEEKRQAGLKQRLDKIKAKARGDTMPIQPAVPCSGCKTPTHGLIDDNGQIWALCEACAEITDASDS